MNRRLNRRPNRRPMWATSALPLAAALLMTTALSAPGAAFAETAQVGAVSVRAAEGLTGARAGCESASAADFNGDGIDDAVAGDPFADVQDKLGAGAVHVLLGGQDGRPGAGGTLPLRSPDTAAGDGFGWSVRTAHVNADKCLDVVVGAPYADVDGTKDAGAAYVFLGGSGTGEPTIIPLRPEPSTDTHFGWSVSAAELAAAGDPGASGTGEGTAGAEGALVAVGAPHADSNGVTDSGAVYVFTVSDSVTASKVITQDSEGVIGNSEIGDSYGWSLAIGNLGGKPGQLDIAVGAPFENNDGAGRQLAAGKPDCGTVGIVYDVLSTTGTYSSKKWDLGQVTTDVKETARTGFGYALDYAEWKGNGYLAVSGPLADAGAVDAGMVQLFIRKGTGEALPARTLRLGTGQFENVPPVKSARIGWSLAFWSPSGGPGNLALAIGSPYEAFGQAPKESGVVRQVDVAGAEGADLVTGTSAKVYEHYGWSVTDIGSANALAPGSDLLVGVPDRPAGGAVAVLKFGKPTYYGPGDDSQGDGNQADNPNKTSAIASADFGFTVSG